MKNGTLGKICRLLSTDKHYSSFILSDVERLFVPPISLGQVVIFEQLGTITGFVTFAFLSPEVENCILNRTRLIEPDDWNSGTNLWLMDGIAPSGNLWRIRQHMFRTFSEFNEIKYVRRGRDGSVLRALSFRKSGTHFKINLKRT